MCISNDDPALTRCWAGLARQIISGGTDQRHAQVQGSCAGPWRDSADSDSSWRIMGWLANTIVFGFHYISARRTAAHIALALATVCV